MVFPGPARELAAGGLTVSVGGQVEERYQTAPDSLPLVEDLRASAGKAWLIICATTPGQAGEALAWDIMQCLPDGDRDKVRRVVLPWLDDEVIREAFEAPHELDLHLVDAWRTRRMIDLLVHEAVAPELRRWKLHRAEAPVTGLAEIAAACGLHHRRVPAGALVSRRPLLQGAGGQSRQGAGLALTVATAGAGAAVAAGAGASLAQVAGSALSGMDTLYSASALGSFVLPDESTLKGAAQGFYEGALSQRMMGPLGGLFLDEGGFGRQRPPSETPAAPVAAQPGPPPATSGSGQAAASPQAEAEIRLDSADLTGLREAVSTAMSQAIQHAPQGGYPTQEAALEAVREALVTIPLAGAPGGMAAGDPRLGDYLDRRAAPIASHILLATSSGAAAAGQADETQVSVKTAWLPRLKRPDAGGEPSTKPQGDGL